MRTTLRVDARTCLLLRSVAIMRAGPGDVLFQTVTTEYQILPATPANLGLLTPPIPAGFTAPRGRPASRPGPATGPESVTGSGGITPTVSSIC